MMGSSAANTGGAACARLPGRGSVAGLLLAHIAVWTIYGTFALHGGVHDDMVEAWAWGKEFQLGYYKHPPLFAWVAGLWFRVLPREDWAFQLLAAVNGTLGLAAVLALAQHLAGLSARTGALLLALLTPLYGALALKFNANSILMPLWPLATLYLARSLERGRPSDAALLGLLAGLGVLGKYYTVLLLVAFLAATLLHPDRGRWWRSPSPWIAAATGALVLVPHVVWLFANDFPTFRYAGTKFAVSRDKLPQWTLVTALAPVYFFLAAAMIVWALVGVSLGEQARRVRELARRPERRWLMAVALGPFLLTLAFGLLGGAKISVSYTFPIFFLVPVLAAMALPEIATAWAQRRLAIAAGLLLVGVAVASPAIGMVRARLEVRGAVEPRREAALALEQLWIERYGRPPALVAGSMAYAGSMPFYAPSSPSHFIHFNYSYAPWVDPARLRREGLLVVCEAEDDRCLDLYRRLPAVEHLAATRLSIVRTASGRPGPPAELIVYTIAPEATPPARATPPTTPPMQPAPSR